MTIRTSLTFTLALTLCAACGVEEEAEPTETPAAESPPAEAAPAEAAPAEEAAEAPAAEAAPAPDGDTMTVAQLRSAFEADQDGTVGREVTVTGVFSSATRVGGELNNVSLLQTRDDDFFSSVVCAFGDDPPESVDLTQYAPITVRGTVRERFDRAALEDCAVVSQ